MSQRNRIVRVAMALLVALALAAPAPTFAARLPEARLSPATAWEMAWSWLTRLLLPDPGAAARGLPSPREKEGGIIDPNGGTPPNPAPPPPPARLRSGGGNS
jgi:hypothetical protein